MKSSKHRFPPQKTPQKNPWKAPLQAPAKPQGVTFIKSPIKLTISLLVSNRIDTIRKCLDSIKPLLTQLPSELIVVDTVGEENSDGSLAVAKEYTDQIVRFHWCDDFAAARNAGLKLANGEWFMFLDDDEWFEDVTPIIDFLRNDDGTYNACQYDVRNYLNHAGSKYQDDKVGRMARRTAATVFKGKIHETLSPIYVPVTLLDCYLHHYGYVYASNEEKMAHSRRNVVPLLEMLEKNPRDMRAITQLCQEYIGISEYKKARALCEETIRFGMNDATLRHEPRYMGFVAHSYIQVLSDLHDYDALMNAADTFVNHEHMPELSKASICVLLQSVNCLQMTEEKALSYVDVYFSCVDALDKEPNKLINQIIGSLGNCQNKPGRNHMLMRSVYLSTVLADWRKALAFIQRAYESGDPSNGFLTGLFTTVASGLEKEADPDKKWPAIRALSELPIEHPCVTIHKMLLAEHEGRTRDLSDLLLEYADQEIETIPAHNLLMLCRRNGVSLLPLVGRIYIEAWEMTVNQLLEKLTKSEHEPFAAYLKQSYGSESSEMLYLDAVRSFTNLKALIKESPTDAAFDAAFAAYVEANAAYYRLRSHPDNFSEARYAYLEINARAAWLLNQALTRKREGRLDQYLRFIRQALACRDYLKDIADYILKRMKVQQAEADTKPSPSQEMLKLSIAIKASVAHLLQARQWPQARAFLDELRAITPDDPDLSSLYAQLPGGV